MIKQTDVANNYWIILDTARDTFNPVSAGGLVANLSDAESAFAYLDVLANGFKLRNTGSNTNTSASTYIYAAFADVPFYYSAQAAATVASTLVSAVAFLMGMAF